MSGFSCRMMTGYIAWLVVVHYFSQLWDALTALYRVQQFSRNIWTPLQNGIHTTECNAEGIGVVSDSVSDSVMSEEAVQHSNLIVRTSNIEIKP